MHSAAKGTVVFAGWDDKWDGYKVVIDHGNGYKSSYSHIKKGGVLVAVGETVSDGQQIALVGSTGMSTGPHVHFQISKNGMPFDPEINGKDDVDYEEMINGMPKELTSTEQGEWERLHRKKNRLEFRIGMQHWFGNEGNKANNIERLLNNIKPIDMQIHALKKKANMRKTPVITIGDLVIDKVEIVEIKKGKK